MPMSNVPKISDDEIRRRARRQPVTIKLLVSGVDRLDDTAHKHSEPGVRMTRSDVLRACMVLGYRHEAELDKILTEMQGERR